MADGSQEAIVARIQWLTEGYSNEELGELCGIHRENVRRWRNGQNKLPATFVAALCEVFDASGDWLLTGKGTWNGRRGR